MLEDAKELSLSFGLVRLEMMRSPVKFHLTGSRKFGTDPRSDWNFFGRRSIGSASIEDSRWIVKAQ